MEEIKVDEMLEVLVVNLITPFILNTKLKPLMDRNNSSKSPRFIINVSAMEGVFHR